MIYALLGKYTLVHLRSVKLVWVSITPLCSCRNFLQMKDADRNRKYYVHNMRSKMGIKELILIQSVSQM